MLLAACLLLASGQQAEDPRAAWSEWRSGLTAATAIAWEASQTWRYGLQAVDETSDGVERESLVPELETSFELRITEQGDFLLNGTTAAPEDGIARISFGLLLDRDGMRAWTAIEAVGGAAPEVHGVRLGRAALDEIYGLLREEMLRIAEEQPETGAEAWSEHARRIFPAGLNACLHPTRAAHRAAALLEVLEFERRDAGVRVLVRPRWSSGSLGAMVDEFGSAAQDDAEERATGMLRAWLTGIERTRGELIFDAADGSLRSASFHGEFPAAAFALDQTGLVRAGLSISSRRHAPRGAPALHGPPDGVNWLDLEPYLEPLRSLLTPREEVPLITPSLPPPPY